jgi:hypothetical protein
MGTKQYTAHGRRPLHQECGWDTQARRYHGPDGLANAEILNKLVEIFDSDFLMNLEPKMEYFGLRGSEVWSTVMVLYEKDVKKKVAQFVEEEEAEDEKWGKDAVAILKSVQNKVEHVHDVLSVSSGHPWQSPTVLPLLPTCALWGVQRTDPGPLFGACVYFLFL